MKYILLFITFVLLSSCSEIEKESDTIETLSVYVMSENNFIVENIETTRENFEMTLFKLFKTKYKRQIRIRVKTNAKIKGLVFVMGIANKNKIKSTLVTSN